MQFEHSTHGATEFLNVLCLWECILNHDILESPPPLKGSFQSDQRVLIGVTFAIQDQVFLHLTGAAEASDFYCKLRERFSTIEQYCTFAKLGGFYLDPK